MDFHFKKHFIIICVSAFCCINLFAQNNEYRAEAGVYAGAGAKTAPEMWQSFRPAFGGMFRYKINKRWSLLASGGMFNLYSKSLPDGVDINHTNSLINIDLTAEFNFFDFEINEFHRNARRITPYIFIGIGVINDNLEKYDYQTTKNIKDNKLHPTVPAGIGLKYKLAPNWNLNIQYTHRLSFTDRLEGIDALSDVYNIKGSNFFNKDMLSAFTVGITVDFWQIFPPCRCKDR